MAIDLTLTRNPSRFILEWDRDRFWIVLHQGVEVGVVVEHQGASDRPKSWNWGIILHAGRFANGARSEIAIEGTQPTRDACLPPFREAFERYLDFIGPDGWAHHVEHMQRIG